MRRYLTNLFIAILILGGVVIVYSKVRMLIIMDNPYGVEGQDYNGHEILLAINKSKVCKKVKKLLIGDSVCNQVYDLRENNDSVYSLSCNQAISLAGHYALLSKFIELNKDYLPEEVILYYNPLSLETNLDKFAFHYFLKNLYYNDDYKPYLNGEVLENRIKEIPMYWSASNCVVRSINWSPEYDLCNENDGSFVSPINRLYLHKIETLCRIKKLTFKFVSSPVRMSKIKDISSVYKDKDLTIRNYSKTIKYLPDSLFMDHVHFKWEKVPNDPLKLYK